MSSIPITTTTLNAIRCRRDLRLKKGVEVASLIGEACLVNCCVNNVNLEALWDTGSAVSIITLDFLKEKLPDLEIQDVSKLAGGAVSSSLLSTVDGTPILHEGWVGVTLLLGGKKIIAPLLVVKNSVFSLIIGYNIIELFTNLS